MAQHGSSFLQVPQMELDRRCQTTQKVHRLEKQSTVDPRNILIEHKGHKD